MLKSVFLLTTLIVTTATPWFEPGNGLIKSASLTGPLPVCQDVSFPCDANLSITDIEYLGQGPTNDRFRVKISLTSPSPCFANSGFGGLGGVQSLFNADFAVSVKVTRRFGHTDTGFENFSRSNSGELVVDVKVPRGTLETDPQSVEASLQMTVTFKATASARVTGSGNPALNSGPQSNSVSGSNAQCFPTVTITGITFAPGAGAQKDAVTVNWTLTQPQSSCLKIASVNTSAKLTRADGSVGAGNGTGSGTTTVQLSGTPGSAASFEVTVSAVAASSPNVKASANRTKTL